MVAAALGFVALAYAIVCGYMALKTTSTDRPAFTDFPEEYGLAYTSVSFASRVDAIPLDGWLLDAPASTTTPKRPIVVVHGMRSDRTREADGHMLAIAAELVRDGHAVRTAAASPRHMGTASRRCTCPARNMCAASRSTRRPTALG